MQNSQCLIFAGSASVSTSGVNLTVNIPITYKPGYAGTHTLFVSASNAAGTASRAFRVFTIQPVM